MAVQDHAGRLSRGYTICVVWLRWPVVGAAVAAVVAATMYLPALSSDAGLPVAGDGSSLGQSERQVLKLFGLPLLSEVAIVQRDPAGFDPARLAATFRQAARINVRTAENGVPAIGIAGALPVPNAAYLKGPPTTLVTYLWGGSALNAAGLVDAAHHYADSLGPRAGVVGVTNVVAVQAEQGRLVEARLNGSRSPH